MPMKLTGILWVCLCLQACAVERDRGLVFRFGPIEAETRASDAAPASPDELVCQKTLDVVNKERQRIGTAGEVFFWMDIVVTLGTVVLGSVASSTSAGEDAMDVAGAVNAQQKFSPAEIASISLGSLAALSTGVTGGLAVVAENRRKEAETIAEVMRDLQTPGTDTRYAVSARCRNRTKK